MNKILLVTGASSDIGMELIRRISANYRKVLAHYCHWNAQLEQLKQEANGNIVFLQADFSVPDSIRNMINDIENENLQPDHIVHFPALKAKNQKFIKTQWQDFSDGWELSLHSLVDILQAFLPHMQKQKYGKIVLMLTSCVLDMPPKYQASYTTVKYALLGLMKSLAVEYGSRGITCNGVSPDMVQTKFLSGLPELLVEQYAAGCSRNRLLAVDEVVPAFEFLLSDGADCVNGVNVGVR